MFETNDFTNSFIGSVINDVDDDEDLVAQVENALALDADVISQVFL